ncbi:MAG: hypothetical protein KDM64_11605 [Verrucomicrobiae bacterium]|nr:hypothetical protein [Verrucomicrobiae bacterium]
MSDRKLTSVHLSFQCPLKWNDFSHEGGKHYCHQCDREILDLTDCTLGEAIELQRKWGPICGFVTVAGVAALTGLSSCSSTEEARLSDSPEAHVTEGSSICVPGKILLPEDLKSHLIR